MSLILRAARFAKKRHEGQTRANGPPYIQHPARVAGRTTLLPDATEEMVAAAWLHDVIEDCDVYLAEIENEFGLYVASLVNELTNTSKGTGLNREGRKKQDRERLATVSHEAKLIKLLDRIDNLGELNGKPSGFAKQYAKESELLVQVVEDASHELVEELRTLVIRAHLWKDE